MTLLSKIARRWPADLLLAAEAFVLLTVFRVCLALMPVRRIIRFITRGHEVAALAESAGGEAAVSIAIRVRWAVEAVSRNSAAKFVCFPQTLAGYTMLRMRGVASTMVYGVARSAEGELIAHTWLTVGDRVVVGGEGSGAFAPLERWS